MWLRNSNDLLTLPQFLKDVFTDRLISVFAPEYNIASVFTSAPEISQV